MNLCRLPLEFEAARLQADLVRVEDTEWVAHYKADDFEGEWDGVALRSLGGQAGNLRATPGMQILYAETPLLARCAYFKEVLDSFACPLGAVRLLRLAAGSSIHEHSDDGLSPRNGKVRLHVPVQTDEDVRFYLSGQLVAMKAGECWYLDLSQPHRVDNRSRQDRVHLILDCSLNNWLADLLNNSPYGV